MSVAMWENTQFFGGQITSHFPMDSSMVTLFTDLFLIVCRPLVFYFKLISSESLHLKSLSPDTSVHRFRGKELIEYHYQYLKKYFNC